MLTRNHSLVLRRSIVAIFLIPVLSSAPLSAKQAAGTTPSAPQGPTLPLTMQQAVDMALEANLGLKSDRLDVAIADQNVVSARSVFKPIVSSGLSRNTTRSAAFTKDDGTKVVPSSSQLSASSQWSQQLSWFGGSYFAQWTARRNASGGGGTFNPSFGSTFLAQFSQPLLRGLKIDGNRFSLQSAERSRAIADLTLQTQIATMQRSVQQAYLSLIAAINGKKVAQQNMELALESLRSSKAKVDVGQSPPIDVTQAQASVSSNEDAVILADASISAAEDALRQLILDPSRPDYWSIKLQLTDEPQTTPREVDVDAAIKNALANRLDLLQLRRQMEITDLSIELAKDSTKYGLNAQVQYSSSGTGGTSLQAGVETVPFRSVLGDAFGYAFPSWTVGLNFNYPLGRSSAQASLARGQIQKQQAEIDLRNAELQVVGAVRNAARNVQSNFQRVRATAAALKANEDQLAAEKRKNEVGLSSTFDVLQKQALLAQANIQALNAVIAYNQALIAFDAIQKIR